MGDEQTQLIQSLIRLLAGDGGLELEGVTFSAKELTLSLSDLAGVPGLAGTPVPEQVQAGLTDVGYHIPARTYPGKIGEVVPGSTRGDGGSRVRSVTIGGATSPPFHLFEGAGPHVPVVAGSVFDIVHPSPDR